MANIVHKWKRFMAVGCSHGIYEDSASVKAMLEWKADFNPDTAIHLGDGLDTTAFRGGAKGTSDESADIDEDGSAYEALMDAFKPDLMFCGNHEHRVWKLMHHHNAIVKKAAKAVVDKIEDIAEKHKAELVPYAGISDARSWRLLGQTAFGHGFIYNENACRDTVEMLGRDVVMAHTHKVQMQKGRTVGGYTGYCVGTLCGIPAMGYASTRRATSAWSIGWAYGEYSEDICKTNLYELKRSQAETTIPVAKCAMH